MNDRSESLQTLHAKIENQDNFSRFVDALALDFENNEEEWESVQVDSFLLALSAFCRDYSARNPQAFENFPWKDVALLFLAGKSYE